VKITRQTTLHFREGTSDKVYEIDQCEVGPDRFVVNFRFGRRGAALKDGSKTPLPVGKAEADKVFDALVREKTAKGYRPFVEGQAEEPAPAPKIRVEDVADPRHQRIIAILQGKKGWTKEPEKLAWRAGELRIREASRAIETLLVGGTSRRTWHAARALLRCGDPGSIPALTRVLRAPDTEPHVKAIVAHALLTLTPAAEREALVAPWRSEVPGGDLPALIAAVRSNPDLPDVLYRVDHDALRGVLRGVPMSGFLGLRRVYQASEARSDGEIWGILAYRFEYEKPAVGSVLRGRARKGPQKGWSPSTRKWFRRRLWRTLDRMGSANMGEDYCRMAAGFLVELAPVDLDGTYETSKWDYNTRRISTYSHPEWTHKWLAGNILFAGSKRFERYNLAMRWSQTKVEPWTGREEAFPEHWDAHPESLAWILGRAKAETVHTFAARALRANQPAWTKIPVAELIGWFSAPFPATVELASEVALSRYDARNPDFALVLALLGCPVASARQAALGWVQANPSVFLRDLSFVASLVLHDNPATRRLALDLLGAATLPAAMGAALVERVVAWALAAPDDDDTTARLRDASAVLATAFSAELHALPLERITTLIGNNNAGVSELGAKALLGHSVRPAQLPDDLLAALMVSPHTVTRGIGIRLYGELDDAVLAERFRVLVAMATNGLPDVRLAVRPIVGRLTTRNSAFARVFLGTVIPILCAEGPEGMHADVVSLFRTEMAAVLPRIEARQVFLLLRATETVVQELGGDLLRSNVDPSTLSPAQLGKLASSDILTIRQNAWALCGLRVDAIRAEPDSVLPLLDARWADSREFAYRFVEDKVLDALPPAVVIAICDSVRPDVQAFGRRVVTQLFAAENGPDYLMQLAQHPSTSMQAYASAWLDQHASGHVDRLTELVPFLVNVLARPNIGKVAKARVFAFLEREAARDEASARVVAQILDAEVLSAAKTHKAASIAILAGIRRRFPAVATRLRVVEAEARG
jgi:predicted DNA-binding WGR domain protein